MRKTLLLVLSLLSGMSTVFADDRADTYTFVQLNAPFPSVDQTLGFGINDFGWVVGNYHDPNGDHGFILRRGVYTPIDVPFAGASIPLRLASMLEGLS